MNTSTILQLLCDVLARRVSTPSPLDSYLAGTRGEADTLRECEFIREVMQSAALAQR